MSLNFERFNPNKGDVFVPSDIIEFGRYLHKFNNISGAKKIFNCSYCGVIVLSCNQVIRFGLCPVCAEHLN